MLSYLLRIVSLQALLLSATVHAETLPLLPPNLIGSASVTGGALLIGVYGARDLSLSRLQYYSHACYISMKYPVAVGKASSQ